MIATDIGAYALPQIGIPSTNSAAATTDGTAIDRMTQGADQGWLSCILAFNVGSASGTPDSFTADCKLQESDASGSGFTDITGAAVTQRTAAGQGFVNVNLKGCKRYIRATVTVAFVNGTSPRLPVAATIVLGGARRDTATTPTA